MKNISICCCIALLLAGMSGPRVFGIGVTDESASQNVKNTLGSVVVAKGQTVKEAMAVNGDVTVYGHVTGDATAVNGNVYVRSGGVIDGSATSVNGKVIKDPGGAIRGSVTTVGGGTAHDKGSGEATNTHGDVVVAKGQTVSEATAIQGDVTVYGHVTGDASAVMGEVDVLSGGVVDGDATAVMGDVTVRSGGTVNGDATAVMGGVIQHIGSHVGGQVTRVGFPVPKWLGTWIPGIGEVSGIAVLLVIAVAFLVFWALVTAVIVAIWPARMQTIAECAIRRPGWSLLYGVVGLLTILPLMILLLITCVGIPLIPVELLFVFIIWLVGAAGVKLAVGQKIGQGIGRPFRSPVWAAVVGSCLLSLITFPVVPMIGNTICYILFTFGFGATIMTGFGASLDWFPRRFSRPPSPPPATPVG